MSAETPTGGSPHDATTKTVRIFTNHESADLAAADLRAHGIQCWITANDAGGMLPNLAGPGGVRLSVQPSDWEAATALLTDSGADNKMPGSDESSDTDSPRERDISHQKLTLPGVIVGIVIGMLICVIYGVCTRLGTKTYYHYAADGRADEARVDRNGTLTELMKDRNHDGAWDYWAYYEQGRIARVVCDNNFDGKPDETWTYDHGTVIKMEKDTDFNGASDEFCTYNNGIIQQIDYRPNGATFPTQRHIYLNGVLTEVLRGADDKGHFTEAVKYDPFFNPVSTNQLH